MVATQLSIAAFGIVIAYWMKSVFSVHLLSCANIHAVMGSSICMAKLSGGSQLVRDLVPGLQWSSELTHSPAFQMAFALVSLAILPWMPESPRFLLSKERYEEADQVLSALADAPVDDSGVQADKGAILEAIALEDARGKFSFKSVVWDRSGQKITLRIILAMAIQMLQEMPGVSS